MSEGDYEHECMRCELLGLPRPDKDTFEQSKLIKTEEASSQDAENLDSELQVEADESIDLKDEHLKNASGGLDELNNILSLTQKKLNKFKVVCGSFTNLLRLKVGAGRGDGSSECSSRGSIGSETEGQREPEDTETSSAPVAGSHNQHELDVSTHVESQIDKLDSLVMKAENAHIRMSSQNKQMKDLLK